MYSKNNLLDENLFTLSMYLKQLGNCEIFWNEKFAF